MKVPRRVLNVLLLAAVGAPLAVALDGTVGIHDPSTVIECNGKWYVYGTGGGSLVSDDGWTWRTGPKQPLNGLAPDVIKMGDKYFMYIASGEGVTKAHVTEFTNRTLDPDSPDYKWSEGTTVASSDGIEDSNAIDPGVFKDPATGRLYLVYGSYFGYIRQVELDPKTGKRLHPGDKPRDLAINCEASDMIFHDGWYYLLATHGSCCRGADSGYNIRVGRSRKVTGPFIDNQGVDMIEGGGKLLAGSWSRFIGPGHFGLLELGDGVEKFSMHYEADLDRGGASVLDIRPLLWQDGWPVAGENLKEGTFEIESARTGTALELAVEGVPVGGGPQMRQRPPAGAPRPAGAPGGGPGGPPPGGGPGGGMGGMFGGVGHPIAAQQAADVSAKWPAGNVDVRLSGFMSQAQQKWTVSPAKDGGGYLGSPYFRISIAGTERSLSATSNGELTVAPTFTSAPEQLWRFDQLADGTWRIMPKVVPGSTQPMALSAVGSGGVTLAKFDAASDRQHWQVHVQ